MEIRQSSKPLRGIEIICLHYKYEAMLATKQGTGKSFDSHWQLWTDRFTANESVVLFLSDRVSVS